MSDPIGPLPKKRRYNHNADMVNKVNLGTTHGQITMRKLWGNVYFRWVTNLLH